MNVQSLCAPWVALHENLGLGAPVRDEAHYAQLLDVVDHVADVVARGETSPLAGLLPLLADRIRDYEDRVHPWPDDSTPATVLSTLMRAHGLRQVEALAKRFSVPMEVFAAG